MTVRRPTGKPVSVTSVAQFEIPAWIERQVLLTLQSTQL
jgi:hypothetical protein